MVFSRLFAQSTTSKQRPTANRVVGIDVGASSIKLLELERRAEAITLTTYGELQLGPYDGERSVGEAVSLSSQLERQALVDILRETSTKATSAVFAIPLSASFVTVMPITSQAETSVDARVRVEAKKYIPLPISEVTLDWVELAASEASTAGLVTHSILLAAIQNRSLERFQSLMDTTQFKNSPTEIECFSTIRGAHRDGDESTAIIDVGAASTKLYLLHEGVLQRMHRARSGGEVCTKQFSVQAKISFEEAELQKRIVTSDDSTYAQWQKIYHNNFDRVLKEFQQVVADYETSTRRPITTIYLTGGGALFPSLPTFVADVFGRTVRFADPFGKVAYPAFMEDTLRDIGPVFTTALGAALRTFE